MQHTLSFRKHFSTLAGLVLAVLGATASPLPAQDSDLVTDTIETATNGIIVTPVIPVLQIKADQVSAQVSPMLYGLMTEEINFSYEGGLYGELVRNRTFKANPTNAVYWRHGRRRGHLARHEPAAQCRVERELETGHEQGVEKFAGGNRQQRLLGNSRQAEHDLSRVVLCQGETFQWPVDGQPVPR